MADGGNKFKGDFFYQDIARKTFWPSSMLLDGTHRIVEAYLNADTAVKAKQRNDFSAVCLTALSSDGFVYLVPLVLKRMETPEVEKMLLLTWAKWRPVVGDALAGCQIEEGAAGSSVVQHGRRLTVHRRVQETRLAEWLRAGNSKESFLWDVPFDWTLDEWQQVVDAPPLRLLPFPVPGIDKVERTQPTESYFRGRNVRLIDAPGTCGAYVWLEQLKVFPMSNHDDAVDASVTGVLPFIGLEVRGREVISASILDSITMRD
jgi:phage terminase large subunit-like protein